MPLNKANQLIGLLKNRGYQSRDRLFRKLVEECGEYAEAIELFYGATRKVDKLEEEIADVVMVGLALARIEGMTIEDVLNTIILKLSEREDEYQRSKHEIE